jgi:DNA polymerase (family 10)
MPGGNGGAAAPADRFAVAAQLRRIAELLDLEGANRYRAGAYARGAEAIEGLSGDLYALVRAKRLTEVAGIGSALAHVIEELVLTGRSEILERLQRDYPPAVRELARVLPVERARTVHSALGVDTLEGLRAACAAGRLRALRGFGAKTEQRLLAHIDQVAANPAHVLLPVAIGQSEALTTFLGECTGVSDVAPAGLIRRRVETVGQLDVVVACADIPAVAECARRYPRATSVHDHGGGNVLLRQAGGLDAHLHIVAPRERPAAWVAATGSPEHVAALRDRAAARGFTLTARGLLRQGRAVRARSEAELYERLGLAYVPPELREGDGELEAAANGTLPAELVRLEDLQGVVHCHTTYSDGKHSIEEMGRAAEALGLRYLTITDHSVSATYARGLTVERLRRQRDEIARVQERVGVRLLRGIESDILRDGSLDYSDAVLEQLDVVIASVHNRYKMDAEQMTTRLLRAVRHPLFKIWGHALGRYVLSRPPFACHMDRVLDAIADSRAAIEVNGDPHRLDLEPRWIRAARRRGIRFVISADAHSVTAIRNLRWGVDMARRGWLQPTDVLNTLGPAEFAAAVRPAGQLDAPAPNLPLPRGRGSG